MFTYFVNPEHWKIIYRYRLERVFCHHINRLDNILDWEVQSYAKLRAEVSFAIYFTFLSLPKFL